VEAQSHDDPNPDSKLSWGEYCFCAQLIRWDHDRHSIRLGYFRRRKGESHWEFASQTTVNSDPKTIGHLLGATLAKPSWFECPPSASTPPAA
jgi:hypothetical protein